MGAANDGLRFLLELGVLGALGWWGFTTAHGAQQAAASSVGELGRPLLMARALRATVASAMATTIPPKPRGRRSGQLRWSRTPVTDSTQVRSDPADTSE